MEHLILKVLSFDVSAPTAHSFLLQYLHRIGAGARLRSVSLVIGAPDAFRGPGSGVVAALEPEAYIALLVTR